MLLVQYLGWPETEGCRLHICFLFVHQQYQFVFCQTEILSCGHMSESEWLTPADMTPTPPRHKYSQIDKHLIKNPKKKHKHQLKSFFKGFPNLPSINPWFLLLMITFYCWLILQLLSWLDELCHLSFECNDYNHLRQITAMSLYWSIAAAAKPTTLWGVLSSLKKKKITKKILQTWHAL